MRNQGFKKKIALISFIVALVLIATVATFIIADRVRHSELEDIRDEMLSILNDRAGEYDESSIVLYNTNERRAKELAMLLGADLRITEDGKFATLTLPESVTIVDVFSDEENLDYIDSFSIDWSARISDISDDDYEREPSRPTYSVNDSGYTNQNYLDYLNIGNVWGSYKGSGVTVAVIDTGIDTDNAEFQGRISNYSYNASEDKIVKDYGNDWSLIEDEQGHGTAVAGVLGASMNGSGIVGVAPEVELLIIKVECDANGNFKRTSDLVFALYYAIERDADVVNMSFGSQSNFNPFEDASRLGRDSDVVMVAAAGNDGSASIVYPAADENVIGVGALANDSWSLADYSNYGENVNIVAPGSVYTLVKNTSFFSNGWTYGSMDGTSFSSPMVAGAIALMKSNSTYRYATNEDITEMLYASCYDIGTLGYDNYYGYGALDIYSLIMGKRGHVTFDYLTDEIEETEQVFIYGNPLQAIPEPERLYSVFDGWYYDIECTEPLDPFVDAFNYDLTLYAKWVNEDDSIPFTYIELEDGTLEITSYTGKRKYITVPSMIEGKTVSSIGEGAFAGETKFRDVKLPDTLNNIGAKAFLGCSNLISIEIPDGVKTIGASAFEGNIRLSYVDIDPTNSALESVGSFAFHDCSSLTTMDLPRSLKNIDGSAFFGAVSLTKININRENSNYFSQSGILFNKNGTELVAYPAGITGSYTLPTSVRTVGSYAFAFTRADQVNLASAITIGGSAFAYSKITKLDIPDCVTSLGDSAFACCFSLSQVNIGDGISSISDRAFANDIALYEITVPSGVRSIGEALFPARACVSLNLRMDQSLCKYAILLSLVLI